jgi:hypothetical protein
MKNYIIISFVLLFLISINSFSEEVSFEPERMITDFNGVVSNGNSTLCYGDYGIITITQNSGKTWQQVNIGDKYNILKIRTFGNNFVGVTGNSYIKSIDNGLNWSNYDGIINNIKIRSFAINNNFIFILHEEGILITDHDFNIQSIKAIALDTALHINEIETAGENLFITAKDKMIIRYNYITLKLDTINLNDFSLCDNCLEVSGLQIHENSIYCILPDYGKEYGNSTLVKSTDFGVSWVNVGYINKTLCYSIFNNDIYYISKSAYKSNDASNPTTIPKYFKIDNAGKSVQISDSTNDIKRSITFYQYSTEKDNFILTELIRINTDTLIAVGKNKLIAVSYNNGVNWEIKSYFDCSITESFVYNPEVVNKNLIYVMNGDKIYKTLNGGITWLPQKYSPEFTGKLGNPIYYNFNDKGSGFLQYYFDEHNPATKLVTSNFGETFSFTNENNPPYITLSPKGIKLNEELIYKYISVDKINNEISNYYSVIKIYDSNYQLQETKRLDSISIIDIKEADNSNLFTLGLSKTGFTKTDTSSFFKNRKYILMQSIDNGRNWTTLPVDVPFKEEILKIPGYGDLNYGIITSIYYWQPYLIMPVSFQNMKTIYIYNTETTKFDSLQLPSLISPSPEKFFNYKGELYVISAENILYHTKSLSTKPVDWDSISINTYFKNWNSYIPNSKTNNKDIIISNWTDDNQIYLFSGKSYRGDFDVAFKINMIKMIKENATSVEDNERTETESVYLSNTKPYPIPATIKISSTIYWNSQYDIRNATIEIFDIYGAKVESNNFEINELNSYSANLIWICSGQNAGIYFIHLSLKGETLSIPVIVVK